jgi:glucose/arabinose dehydrogenase
MRRALAAVLVVTVLACSADEGDGDGADSATTMPATTTTTSAAGSTGTTEPVTLDQAAVTLTEIAELDAPTAFAVRSGDTRLYLTERVGRVRRLIVDERGRITLDRTPVLDISGDVTAGGEQGLLGLAFSSDGRSLFVAYTGEDEQQYVDEVTMTTERADPRSRRNVLTVPDFASNHNGGQLAFGPDGFLYYGMGDGGGGGDPEGTGQDPTDLLGSLLRIDPDGGDPYAVPSSNPFADGEDGAPEVFAFGLRNPWRFSFDRQTGDLWLADVGQGEVEEIDHVASDAGRGRGANFGWSAMEGDRPYDGDEPSDHVPPLLAYDHGDGRCAVVGGFVYRGTRIANLAGAYVYGDYCDGHVRALVERDGELVADRDLGVVVPSLSSFGEDAAGELYAVSLDGQVYRIDPG